MIRRQFLTAPLFAAAAAAQEAPARKKVDKGPPIAIELVKEFVGAGHSDLVKVKAMLAEQPGLIKVAYDWGGGDYETALGGAGHMGQREIAEYLIAQGAPLELHAAAMLGKLEFVKAAIAAFPNAAQIPGPHKITLIAHARKGGEPAQAVVKFLEGLG
ncbi:MAG: ankyrin repeat domain-containing protein [Acidobacteria bacterium]|nr:ankyrin repeat domain-containing protein [Acidobacteriota bacterium]